MSKAKKFKVDMFIGLNMKGAEVKEKDLYRSLVIEADDFKEAESKFYKEVSIYPRSHHLEINEIDESDFSFNPEEKKSTKIEFSNGSVIYAPESVDVTRGLSSNYFFQPKSLEEES